MPETDYLKIPQNRVGALIGSNGNVKKSIEKATGTILDMTVMMVQFISHLEKIWKIH